MRVVAVSPLPPARDGVASYAARLLEAYGEDGTEVAVVTSTSSPVTAAPVLGRLSCSPATWWRTYRQVVRWRPDALHVQHGIATYGVRLAPLGLLAAAARAHRVPVVVTHHEVTRDLARLGAVGLAYYRGTALLTSLVHVHTEASAAAVRTRLGVPADRVLVFPHPVYSLPAATIGKAELRRRHGLGTRRVLLAFGYVHVEKGLVEVVEGLAELLRRQPARRGRVVLVVAGDVRPRPAAFGRFEAADRDHLETVRRRVREHGLDGDVVFTGHVPDGEVATWFRACHTALLTYTATEQSGVANLAIAAGAPVLATAVGGLAELFAGTQPMLASLEPGDVADALAASLDAPDARARCARPYAELLDRGSPRRLAAAVRQRLGRGGTAGGPRVIDVRDPDRSPGHGLVETRSL